MRPEARGLRREMGGLSTNVLAHPRAAYFTCFEAKSGSWAAFACTPASQRLSLRATLRVVGRCFRMPRDVARSRSGCSLVAGLGLASHVSSRRSPLSGFPALKSLESHPQRLASRQEDQCAKRVACADIPACYLGGSFHLLRDVNRPKSLL